MENKGVEERSKVAPKLPFTPLHNLSNQREASPMMAHRRPNHDPHGNENAPLVGNKLPRCNAGKIKDRISLWEGKEPTHLPITSGSSGQCTTLKRTESLPKSNNKTTDEPSAESCRRVTQREKENIGKETVGDFKKAAHKDKEDHEKENVEKLGDSRPCSPTVAMQQQVGTLRKTNDKRATEQTSQEKRAVFSLFKKLEAMGENHGKTPTELGNYFSPPSKDKQVEARRKESDTISQSGLVKSTGTQPQEHVYTEPGTLPINPVPKPRRTFEHPAVVPMGRGQRQGRGQRNLPPLPSISRPSSKLPSGVYGRPRGGERARDNVNRYSRIIKHVQ